MMQRTPRAVRTAAILLVTIVGLVAAGPASAGCLREFGKCGDCAERAMNAALWDLDPGGVLDAYVDGVDCDIDLLHCIVYDSHHSYSCGT